LRIRPEIFPPFHILYFLFGFYAATSSQDTAPGASYQTLAFAKQIVGHIANKSQRLLALWRTAVPIDVGRQHFLPVVIAIAE
jgi:hypothetical protein